MSVHFIKRYGQIRGLYQIYYSKKPLCTDMWLHNIQPYNISPPSGISDTPERDQGDQLPGRAQADTNYQRQSKGRGEQFIARVRFDFSISILAHLALALLFLVCLYWDNNF